mgnify:FL=1
MMGQLEYRETNSMFIQSRGIQFIANEDGSSANDSNG